MKKILAALLLCASLNAGASNQHLCFPENDLYIPSNLKSVRTIGMNKKIFDTAINDIEKIYKPIFVKEYGSELQVIRKWDDATVNAYAQQTGKIWKVSMFGGLARHETITPDGFRAVVCHEVGHHIGGAPKIKSWTGSTSWASNEGQADYFATSKCLKKFFKADHEKTIEIYEAAGKEEEDDNANSVYSKRLCDDANSSLLEAAICFRGAMAGQSLAELFRVLRKLPNELRFDSPDKGIVTKTNHKHPAPQCRMDTYFQGALCNKDPDLLPSQTDASTSYCNRKNQYKLGIRPLCWLNLAEYNL
jgi:hypothetical protein